MRSRTPIIIALALIAVAGSGGALVFASGAESDQQAPPPLGSVPTDPELPPIGGPGSPPAVLDTPQVEAPGAAQTAQFSVMSRPQRANDVRRTGIGLHGANRALARTVETKAGAISIVPARGHICLEFPETGSQGCTTDEAAADGLSVYSQRTEEKLIRAFVLVPDGASNFVVKAASSTTQVEPERNIIAVNDPDATSIAFDLPDGRRVTREL